MDAKALRRTGRLDLSEKLLHRLILDSSVDANPEDAMRLFAEVISKKRYIENESERLRAVGTALEYRDRLEGEIDLVRSVLHVLRERVVKNTIGPSKVIFARENPGSEAGPDGLWVGPQVTLTEFERGVDRIEEDNLQAFLRDQRGILVRKAPTSFGNDTDYLETLQRLYTAFRDDDTPARSLEIDIPSDDSEIRIFTPDRTKLKAELVMRDYNDRKTLLDKLASVVAELRKQPGAGAMQ
jgi:hypothetical protein